MYTFQKAWAWGYIIPIYICIPTVGSSDTERGAAHILRLQLHGLYPQPCHRVGHSLVLVCVKILSVPRPVWPQWTWKQFNLPQMSMSHLANSLPPSHHACTMITGPWHLWEQKLHTIQVCKSWLSCIHIIISCSLTTCSIIPCQSHMHRWKCTCLAVYTTRQHFLTAHFHWSGRRL